MSELNLKKSTDVRLRWQLLTTASVVTLLSCTMMAQAGQHDEPQVWIELGGQLTRLDIGQESYLPDIMKDRPSMFHSSTKLEELPHQSIDEMGELSFRPRGSDWVFSAGVRYGRSNRRIDKTQQTYPARFYATFQFNGQVSNVGYHGPIASRFASTEMTADESHLVLDFQAGKDVGLGLFGGTSQVNLGVRFAQFHNKSNIALNSDPDWQRFYKYATFTGLFTHLKVWNGEAYHSHSGRLQAERNFRGIGPSLSWSGSSPFAGNHEDGELLFDYGANAAVLFGRQRAKVAHQTSSFYHSRHMAYLQQGQHIPTPIPSVPPRDSKRTVIVPNIGALAGVTYRIHDLKISAGYRADFFFNAMDGGNDVRRSEKIGNYGPFATISIGLGG